MHALVERRRHPFPRPGDFTDHLSAAARPPATPGCCAAGHWAATMGRRPLRRRSEFLRPAAVPSPVPFVGRADRGNILFARAPAGGPRGGIFPASTIDVDVVRRMVGCRRSQFAPRMYAGYRRMESVHDGVATSSSFPVFPGHSLSRLSQNCQAPQNVSVYTVQRTIIITTRIGDEI